jgi:hypothetical protein
MRYIVALILWGICLSAWADGTYAKIAVGERVGYVVPKEVAEKPDSEVRKTWPPPYLDKDVVFWTPGEKDIAAVEEGLQKCLETAKANPKVAFDLLGFTPQDDKFGLIKGRHEIGLLLGNFKNYEVQYIGLEAKGQKRILCNFFDLPPAFRNNTDPSSRIVDVMDGGHMYWQIEYNCVSKEYTKLSINGPWEWDENVIPRGNQVILPGDWKPTKEGTDKALMAVAVYMEDMWFKNAMSPAEKYQVDSAKIITGQMFRYCVQFVGKTIHGRKVVYCNFLLFRNLDEYPDWKRSEIQVKDGGTDFWQIYYDPETEKCSDLQINGEA